MWIPQQYCGYNVPEPTRRGEISKPLRPSRHRFWKAPLGNSGDLSCLELATEPSPPLSADGSSTADTPPSGFSAAGLGKAPLDCSFDPRAEGAMTTARPSLSILLLLHFSSSPVSPADNGNAVLQPVLSHTPPCVVVQQ